MTANSNIRLLGLFAHPDDEVFCIGGTLAKYAASGAETMVVSFTRGEAGQIRDASIASRRTLAATREQELLRSCSQLGVQHVRCLDYGDGKLNDIPQQQLLRQATQIIREFQPDVVFSFDDTGAYGHPDHDEWAMAFKSVTFFERFNNYSKTVTFSVDKAEFFRAVSFQQPQL